MSSLISCIGVFQQVRGICIFSCRVQVSAHLHRKTQQQAELQSEDDER